MATSIYVNLPVKDLEKSREFFTQLRFGIHPQFSDDSGVCLIVSDTIFVMLLTEEKFQTFTPHPICDARQSTEVIVCLSCETRSAVDELVRNAVAAGGRTYSDPIDHGFMYGHGFQDLDGHIWELVYMDPGAVPQS